MSVVKQIIKSFFAAFSIYSKIPVPHFNWDSDDMKFHLCFFPWVGAVIGAVEFLLYRAFSEICAYHPMFKSSIVFPVAAILIPILITGGFHIDGFMDTMDALHSYGDREKKLEILKDPHVGAFSIICLAIYFLFLLGSTSVVFLLPDEVSYSAVICICFSFFISRCLSGISVIVFPKARKSGMLAVESKTSAQKFVLAALLIQLAVSFILLFYILSASRLIILLTFLCSMGLSFSYFFFTSKKQFGGITGDLCGWFVCISEAFSVIMLALILFGDEIWNFI